jgi:hypothetical protein
MQIRTAVIILPILLTQILFAQGSLEKRVCFTVGEANVILDSLYARGDWKMMYVIQSSRYQNASQALTLRESLDSLTTAQLAMCDSTARKGYSDNRELISENSRLQRKVKNKRGWLWGLVLFGAVMTAVNILK